MFNPRVVEVGWNEHYKLSHKQRERAEASEPRERSGASGSPRASV